MDLRCGGAKNVQAAGEWIGDYLEYFAKSANRREASLTAVEKAALTASASAPVVGRSRS